MESVRRLSLTSGYITTESIQLIADLPNLEELDIDPVRGKTVDLKSLENHPHLKLLALGYHPDRELKGPVPLEHLAVFKTFPNLRVLYLSFGDVTDEAVDTLKSMSHLEELSLDEASVEQIAELRDALPDTNIHPPRVVRNQ